MLAGRGVLPWPSCGHCGNHLVGDMARNVPGARQGFRLVLNTFVQRVRVQPVIEGRGRLTGRAAVRSTGLFAYPSMAATAASRFVCVRPTPKGARLLPPRDPYMQLRDRETIIDKKYHRDVWKPVGDPGAVLVDGEIAGVWRPRKSGRNLTISIKAFGSLPAPDRKSLQAEAEQFAPLRGVSSVDVKFDTY